jgi:hypothetical protein
MKFHPGSAITGAIAGFLVASVLGFVLLRVSATNMRASYGRIIDSAYEMRRAGVDEERTWQILKESTRPK